MIQIGILGIEQELRLEAMTEFGHFTERTHIGLAGGVYIKMGVGVFMKDLAG